MSATSKKCLVLNSDFSPLAIWPLSFISAEEAIKSVYQGKAYVISEWDEVYRSPSTQIRVPKCIVLNDWASVNSKPKFCRRSILLRDRFTCFPAGTRILLSNGQQKPIELINIGDRLIDAFGNPVTVVNTGKSIANNCVKIKNRGSFEETIVTADHPFLVDGCFKPIQDVEIGTRKGGGPIGFGYLMFPKKPKYEISKAKIIDISKFIPQNYWYRYKNGRLYCSRHSHASGMPVTIEQSPDLAYLLGLYVAEGSTNETGQIRFSFCDDEEHTLAKDAANLMQKVFGINTWTNIDIAHHGCTVGASCKTLAQVLWATCGKGAKNKKTPWELIGPYHAEYLKGLFLGDGHLDNLRKKVSLTMTGFDAVLGAQSMLWGLGIYPTFQHNHLDGKLPILTLVLNGENRQKFFEKVLGQKAESGKPIFGNETHVFRRLVKRSPLSGMFEVYNLETNGSHSYIANGLAVHNCQYCGKKFKSEDLSYDHVLPRSLGGKTTWENIVCACNSCNAAKADKMPNLSGRKGGGLRPLKMPRQPTTYELLNAGLELLDPQIKEDFHEFLYWNVELEK